MKKLTSTNALNRIRLTNNCPLTSALLLISGRWKLIILWQLKDGARRFTELQKAIPHSSKKMLSQQLREMEVDGLIARKRFAENPPRVDYWLTELGESLLPVLKELYAWGEAHHIIEHIQRIDEN